MGSYRYGDSRSKTYVCKTFEQFVEFRYNINLQFNGVSNLKTVTFNNGREGIRYNGWQEFYFGDEYYLGNQFSNPWEKEAEYPHGVYKLVGCSCKDGDRWPTMLELKNRNGDMIKVREGAILLKKEEIIDFQRNEGFSYPSELKRAWPDLVENPKNMPKPETEIGVKPGVRNHIDAILALIIWVLGIVFLSTIKGGEFSFNFAGSVAYYGWILFGGLIVFAKFFTREKR